MKLHPVAGKCGVFAETDINGLQKQGVPPDELMASLFESIIQQNLSVLTRGNTLRPTVLLLGGPNCYIKGMRDCWKHNIPKIWEERNYPLPEGVDPQDADQDARQRPILRLHRRGRVRQERRSRTSAFTSATKSSSGTWAKAARRRRRRRVARRRSPRIAEELAAFKQKYTKKKFIATTFQPGQVVEGFIGIDGGSTSTKAVLVDKDRNILCKTYQLSRAIRSKTRWKFWPRSASKSPIRARR